MTASKLEIMVASMVGMPSSAELLARVRSVAELPTIRIFDGTRLYGFSTALFDAISDGLVAAPHERERVAIVVPFDIYAVFRMICPATRAAGGVSIRFFHATQFDGGDVHAWIEDAREPDGYTDTVLELLERQWRPTAAAPMVLDAIAEQIRSGSGRVPMQLACLSEIAYRSVEPRYAEPYARDALERMPDLDGADTKVDEVRAGMRAMHVLASVLEDKGEIAGAIAFGERALDLAERRLDQTAVVTCLLLLGVSVLRSNDWRRSEGLFRRAAALVDDVRQRDLAARAHHNLATALLCLGRFREAEIEGARALSLRDDLDGRLATQDREVIALARNGERPAFAARAAG